ncbi:hypothetical protein DNK65_21395 [Citrobacter koseri]|uniref:Uncharacterized protein n=1 Tax=Citrobacter koseri TaxID=545 RepID=A0A2X2WKR7_CITKO|nr:hypothetical protein DL345_16435 [Citrobacter koseri]PYZ80616.1 hypothetical protein DNK65_21395 [Citrobacter koseri]SQB36515.1 Uncharacterised protein [Citrobacter koseri]STA83205.1 Uncharacterised protein [Citrobacter koseri]STT23819.1 Uncharacterised protein [Citrobacter koseri]
METCDLMQLKNCIKCSIAHILHDKTAKWPIFSQVSAIFRHQDANGLTESIIISVFEREKFFFYIWYIRHIAFQG